MASSLVGTILATGVFGRRTEQAKAKFDPRVAPRVGPRVAATRAPTKAPTRADFPCFQPFKDSPQTSHEGVHRRAHEWTVGVHLSRFPLFCYLTSIAGISGILSFFGGIRAALFWMIFWRFAAALSPQGCGLKWSCSTCFNTCSLTLGRVQSALGKHTESQEILRVFSLCSGDFLLFSRCLQGVFPYALWTLSRLIRRGRESASFLGVSYTAS